MMVDETLHGRGIGRALPADLLAIADRDLGLVRVELEVYADNERAIRLYERSGFAVEGRKRKARFRDGAFAGLLVMAGVR